MTTPEPTTEERLSALELALDQFRSATQATLGQLQEALGGLAIQADQLRERHSLLEAQMIAGLGELQKALDAINARRPPVRRKLQELEERLDVVAPPAGEQPAGSDPVTEEGSVT